MTLTGVQHAVVDGASAGVLVVVTKELDGAAHFGTGCLVPSRGGALAHHSCSGGGADGLRAQVPGDGRGVRRDASAVRSDHRLLQGIKHKLVDLLIAIELPEFTVPDASGGADRGAMKAADHAAASRVLASRAAMTAAEEAIQVHG